MYISTTVVRTRGFSGEKPRGSRKKIAIPNPTANDATKAAAAENTVVDVATTGKAAHAVSGAAGVANSVAANTPQDLRIPTDTDMRPLHTESTVNRDNEDAEEEGALKLRNPRAHIKPALPHNQTCPPKNGHRGGMGVAIKEASTLRRLRLQCTRLDFTSDQFSRVGAASRPGKRFPAGDFA